ncbi:MAG: hypothetical protein AAB468_00665 [Patescibacteria group bacterium]
MLNPWPELLTFGLVAPLGLRLVAGLVFVNSGWQQIKTSNEKLIGLCKLLGGGLITLGLFTQPAAALLGLWSLRDWKTKRGSQYPLLAAICLSLLFSGAGFFAFDWPL